MHVIIVVVVLLQPSQVLSFALNDIPGLYLTYTLKKIAYIF